MLNALSDFIIYCRVERRLSELTCKAYERDVRACLDFLRSQGINALAAIHTSELRRFLAEESTIARRRQAKRAPSRHCGASFVSASRAIISSATLHTSCVRQEARSAAGCARPRRAVAPVGCAARDGVWERVHAGKVERDRLLLALFAYAGLRRSEPLGLDCDDVDLHRRLIRVRNAKGGRQRVVPIHPGLVPLFVTYAATRASVSHPALFVGVHGRRLTPSIMALTFRRYATTAGVNKRKHITPHAAPRLRHGAPERGRQPAADSGAPRAQAPGLHAALHTRERPSASRRTPLRS